VKEYVLDASVLLGWFAAEGEASEGARRLRREFEAGQLSVIVPPPIHLEILNVAGRRWGWRENALGELADSLEALPLELVEPELQGVAAWVSRGLTAYDAAYVALAEGAGIPLVTEDASILAVAGTVARRPP